MKSPRYFIRTMSPTWNRISLELMDSNLNTFDQFNFFRNSPLDFIKDKRLFWIVYVFAISSSTIEQAKKRNRFAFKSVFGNKLKDDVVKLRQRAIIQISGILRQAVIRIKSTIFFLVFLLLASSLLFHLNGNMNLWCARWWENKIYRAGLGWVMSRHLMISPLWSSVIQSRPTTTTKLSSKQFSSSAIDQQQGILSETE